MRLQIALPPDVGERVRTIAESEHRDIRHQIEKIVIDAVRNFPDQGAKKELAIAGGAQ